MILFWFAEKAVNLLIMVAIALVVVACMGAGAVWRKLTRKDVL